MGEKEEEGAMGKGKKPQRPLQESERAPLPRPLLTPRRIASLLEQLARLECNEAGAARHWRNRGSRRLDVDRLAKEQK